MELPPELKLDFVDENPTVHNIEINTDDIDDTLSHLVEKEPINHDNIFDDSQEPKNKETGEVNPNFIYEEAVVEPKPKPKPKKEKPIKYNKDGSVRKPRVYTEEQKIAMRERMKKAREQSGKNKAKKQEEKAKQQKYKELMEKKKDLEMEEVEEKLKNKSKPKQDEPKQIIHQNIGISKEDLQKAQILLGDLYKS